MKNLSDRHYPKHGIFNPSELSFKCWTELANGIVLQAVKDYKERPEMRGEIREFFYSQWYQLLTGVDYHIILNHLKENEQNGKRTDEH